MKLNLNDALDESLALLETGQASLEECAARYPEYSADLLSLLATAFEVRRVDPPTPSPAASMAGELACKLKSKLTASTNKGSESRHPPP